MEINKNYQSFGGKIQKELNGDFKISLNQDYPYLFESSFQLKIIIDSQIHIILNHLDMIEI
jgi:hypothetical protein